MREISSSTNVDTKKSGNLFQAKSRISKLEELEGGNSLPKEVAIKIETESPISAFFIQDYILNVFMDYFPLRKEFPLEDQTRIDKDDEMFGRG
jgi:hypothetical protein